MLTSPHNPRLARIRSLLDKRKAREEEQAFVVEGVRLAEEALAASWTPEQVFFTSQLSERGQIVVNGFRQLGAEVTEVDPRLMDTLTGTETPQGLLAVLPMRKLPLPAKKDFLLIADNLRDPGNLGTLLRTAAAASVQAVLLSPGTTDPFAPKVVRSGMGAHFRLPVYALSWEEIRAVCKGQAGSATFGGHAAEGGTALRIFLAEAAEGAECWDLDLRQPLALMVGSEAEGASPEAQAMADQAITIPMPGKSESLNAAIAASILLFEIVRQRRAQ